MHTGTQKDCSQDLDSLKSQNQLKMGCGLSQFSQNTGEVQAYVASAANSTKGELTPVWCKLPESRKRKHLTFLKAGIVYNCIRQGHCEKRNLLPMSFMKTDAKIKSDIFTN